MGRNQAEIAALEIRHEVLPRLRGGVLNPHGAGGDIIGCGCGKCDRRQKLATVHIFRLI
jgi:hypothetical protein